MVTPFNVVHVKCLISELNPTFSLYTKLSAFIKGLPVVILEHWQRYGGVCVSVCVYVCVCTGGTVHVYKELEM